MHSNRFLSFIPVSLLLLSLTGCFGTTPPAQFYLLEPSSDTSSQSIVTSTKPLIVITRVHIPEYIDRSQIVTATSKNAYKLAEFDRWAEPLNDNIARVLQQDLAALVPADVVFANGSNRAKLAELRASVNILEFHADPQHQARLTVQWQIARGDKTIVSKTSSYQSPAAHDDYPAIVAALNTCLKHFSNDLSAALRQSLTAK